MKTFLKIAFLFTILACQQAKQSEPIVTEDLKYSAYSWYYSPNNWEFYLAQYLDIDKSGHFVIMRHDSFQDQPKYFTGIIKDTVRQLINKTFNIDTFKTDYYTEAVQNIFYDGLTYCFEYKKENNKKKRVLFIPSKSPDEIRKLSSLLNAIIYNTKVNRSDTIDISYANELKRFSSNFLGPLPVLKKPEVKWRPKKISK